MQEQNQRRGPHWAVVFIGLMVVMALLVTGVIYVITLIIRQTAQDALSPVQQANDSLRTQVAEFLNPTPTILPDPVTIIHDVRSLARLETIQYTVEKVISAETNQNAFGFLFGDKLLFVAHGVVIAGVDLSKMQPEDIEIKNNVLYVQLPPAEIFVSTLDNEKSYVYNRETGLLTRGEKDLETSARQAAEQEILKAAVNDGILNTAQANAENFLSRMLRDLGYSEVIFQTATPVPAAVTPSP